MRILIVEDSETQALRIGLCLEQEGLEVVRASSAEAALEELNRMLPDLMITDYNLPGMLGDELCRRIRMNVNARGMPILMLTGEEDEQFESRALDSGADEYVRKSENLNVLLLRVQSLLRKSRVGQVVDTGAARFAAVKILAVEDSPTYLQYIELELKEAGYLVETASTAAEAVARLEQEPFDGVVLDLVLPDAGGTGLCERIDALRKGVEDPFVMLALTGLETKEDTAGALAAGADDVVSKSRDMSLVKARLRALMRRKLLYAENRRIAGEFQRKELEVVRARAEKNAAEVRAALAGELEARNRELAIAYRELQQAQSQLVQSAKMASLGALVAGVAHEINNPLAFVASHLGTVTRGLEGLAPELEPHLSEQGGHTLRKLRQRLKDMRVGVERVEDLVVKLRTFSRLDEGEIKDVNIEESIESVLTLLQHKLANRIEVERQFGRIKRISCYAGPLNQVIMNIISNAIDAIEGDGRITIATSDSGSTFILSVADTGKGIPAAIRDRIFEPFFTTKPVGAGTGLGLSISYGVIQKHGGTLNVESAEGKGTTFVIKIPIRQERVEDGH